MPASPAFAVTTCARPAAPRWPVSPPMLTIEPPPALAIWGAQACEHRNAPSRITASTRRQSVNDIDRERLLGPDRGIVHEDIDSSEALDGRLHHRGHGVGIGHVGDVAPRAATGGLDIAHRLVHIGVGMQRIDHHVGAAGGERARDRPADVAGAAGDQRDFPVQFPARHGIHRCGHLAGSRR